MAGAEDPLRAEVAADRASLWLGPDEYLLIDSGAAAGSDAHAADLALRLEAAMGTVPHALVDVSHRQTAIEVPVHSIWTSAGARSAIAHARSLRRPTSCSGERVSSPFMSRFGARSAITSRGCSP